MRLFYLICIGIVLLSGIGSLYLYLDTKRFSENLQKTPQTETTKQLPTATPSVESLPQHNSVTHTTDSDSQSENVAAPAWSNDAAQGIDDRTHTDNPWTQDTPMDEVEKIQTDSEGEFFDPRDPAMNEIVRQKLIKQFGDIPEVHIYVDGRLKALTGAPTTLQEKIERAEASNKLFPNPTTQRTLTLLYAARSYDIDKIMPFVDTPKDERFADVIPFFEGKRPEEGFRTLRAVSPNRTAELEQFLLQESEKDLSMREEVKRAIARSYKPLIQNK